MIKVKMYSNLVSTIPAAIFVSFLGPISDQVPKSNVQVDNIFSRLGERFQWRSPSSATFSSLAFWCSMSMPRIGLLKQLSQRQAPQYHVVCNLVLKVCTMCPGLSVFYRNILRKQYIASFENITKYRDIRGYHDILLCIILATSSLSRTS